MKISEKYNLPARELKFVNVDLSIDNRFFIDPYKLKNGKTDLHKRCYYAVSSFIDYLLKLAKQKEYERLSQMINNLHERNETKFGYSLSSRYGKSFGIIAGTDLVGTLSRENIWESGVIKDIFDCIMLIPNVGEDKVSDLVTTIILSELITFTQEQCKLWKIPMEKKRIKKQCWNYELNDWEYKREELPVHNGRPFILVPKSFTDKQFKFSYERLYRELIIPFYKKREIELEDSVFVVQYKNGEKHVLGNLLRKRYPCTKYVVMDFIKQYDDVYREYKKKILK